MISSYASVVNPISAIPAWTTLDNVTTENIPVTITSPSILSSNLSIELSNLSLNESYGNGSFANGTLEEAYYPEIPSYIRTTSMVFCIIIMCLGVVGNVMVPIVILKTKDMRNSTNIFLTNLSIADLMVLLVCTPTVLVEVNTRPETWVLGEQMCKAVPFVELTVAHASVLTILAISFERYYAICEPLKAGYVCTKTRALLICSLAWVVAALFTSPILGVAEYRHLEYHDGSTVPVCLTQATEFWPTLFFLMTISVFFLIPLLILLVLYTIIAKNLISDASKVALNKHVDSFSLKARRQVVLMLGTVVVSFFLCLLPFRVLTLWIIIVPDETVMRLGIEKYYNLLYFCRTMLYLNSAVNPILYNLMSSKFRDGFLRTCWIRRKNDFNKRCMRNRNGTLNTTTTSSYNSNGTVKKQSNEFDSPSPARSQNAFVAPPGAAKILTKSHSFDWMENTTLLCDNKNPTLIDAHKSKEKVLLKQTSTPVMIHERCNQNSTVVITDNEDVKTVHKNIIDSDDMDHFNDVLVSCSSMGSLRKNVLVNCAKNTLDITSFDYANLKEKNSFPGGSYQHVTCRVAESYV